MKPVAIVPTGGDCHWRLDARVLVTADLASRGIAVVEAPGAEPWSKGAAVNPVAAHLVDEHDVLIIHDGDCMTEPAALDAAVRDAMGHGWAMPHGRVRRLDRESTRRALDRGASPRNPGLARPAYWGLPGGGVLCIRVDAWRTVRGIDPRFVGWGGEDYALGVALHALTGRAARQRHATLTHLWHPPQPDAANPSAPSKALAARYRHCRRNPDAMRALVGEW